MDIDVYAGCKSKSSNFAECKQLLNVPSKMIQRFSHSLTCSVEVTQLMQDSLVVAIQFL